MKSTLLLALLVIFTAHAGFVAAAAPDYDILSVEVNDLQAFGGGSAIPNLDVERGDTLDIEVVIQGNATISGGQVPDVRIEAKIVGYEFGTISDISDIFSVDENLVYRKTLTLVIPEDIDASELYTLRIEASDPNNEEQVEFQLNIDEQRHSLNIFDIVVNPSTSVMAGQPIFPIVRVENLGERKEDDVRVTVSIPELGISTTNYINDLITEIQEDQEVFRLDERSSAQLDFLLRIPEDAKTGEYTLKVDVMYNIQVDGVAPWGQYRVEPGFITVLPDGTAEATLFIRANDNAEPRNYVSVVRVMMGREIVHEFNVNTEVVGMQKSTSAVSLKT